MYYTWIDVISPNKTLKRNYVFVSLSQYRYYTAYMIYMRTTARIPYCIYKNVWNHRKEFPFLFFKNYYALIGNKRLQMRCIFFINEIFLLSPHNLKIFCLHIFHSYLLSKSLSLNLWKDLEKVFNPYEWHKSTE